MQPSGWGVAVEAQQMPNATPTSYSFVPQQSAEPPLPQTPTSYAFVPQQQTPQAAPSQPQWRSPTHLNPNAAPFTQQPQFWAGGSPPQQGHAFWGPQALPRPQQQHQHQHQHQQQHPCPMLSGRRRAYFEQSPPQRPQPSSSSASPHQHTPQQQQQQQQQRPPQNPYHSFPTPPAGFSFPTWGYQQQQQQQQRPQQQHRWVYPGFPWRSPPTGAAKEAGSSKATQASIAKVKIEAVEADNLDPCAICLESFEAGDVVYDVPCYHVFHTDCIEEWWDKEETCPTCRVNPREKSGVSVRNLRIKEWKAAHIRRLRRTPLTSLSDEELVLVLQHHHVKADEGATRAELMQLVLEVDPAMGIRVKEEQKPDPVGHMTDDCIRQRLKIFGAGHEVDAERHVLVKLLLEHDKDLREQVEQRRQREAAQAAQPANAQPAAPEGAASSPSTTPYSPTKRRRVDELSDEQIRTQLKDRGAIGFVADNALREELEDVLLSLDKDLANPTPMPFPCASGHHLSRSAPASPAWSPLHDGLGSPRSLPASEDVLPVAAEAEDTDDDDTPSPFVFFPDTPQPYSGNARIRCSDGRYLGDLSEDELRRRLGVFGFFAAADVRRDMLMDELLERDPSVGVFVGGQATPSPAGPVRSPSASPSPARRPEPYMMGREQSQMREQPTDRKAKRGQHLVSLSTSDLKAIASALGVAVEDVLEKSDLVELICEAQGS